MSLMAQAQKAKDRSKRMPGTTLTSVAPYKGNVNKKSCGVYIFWQYCSIIFMGRSLPVLQSLIEFDLPGRNIASLIGHGRAAGHLDFNSRWKCKPILVFPSLDMGGYAGE